MSSQRGAALLLWLMSDSETSLGRCGKDAGWDTWLEHGLGITITTSLWAATDKDGSDPGNNPVV